MTTSKDEVTITIHGMKEAHEILKGLPYLEHISILRSIHKEAGKRVIVPALKASLPFSSQTKKHLIAGVATGKFKVNPSSVLVGVGLKSFFLRYLERGTVERKTRMRSVRKYSRTSAKTGGASRGTITGRRRVEPIIFRQVPNIIKYLDKHYGAMTEKYLIKQFKASNKKVAKMVAAKGK